LLGEERGKTGYCSRRTKRLAAIPVQEEQKPLLLHKMVLQQLPQEEKKPLLLHKVVLQQVPQEEQQTDTLAQEKTATVTFAQVGPATVSLAQGEQEEQHPLLLLKIVLQQYCNTFSSNQWYTSIAPSRRYATHSPNTQLFATHQSVTAFAEPLHRHFKELKRNRRRSLCLAAQSVAACVVPTAASIDSSIKTNTG